MTTRLIDPSQWEAVGPMTFTGADLGDIAGGRWDYKPDYCRDCTTNVSEEGGWLSIVPDDAWCPDPDDAADTRPASYTYLCDECYYTLIAPKGEG